MTLWIFSGSLLGAMALGMPIAFALLVCGVALMATMGNFAPRLTDKMMTALFDMQVSDRPEDDRTSHSLYAPTTGLKERGGRAPHVSETSFYTQASLHPMFAGAALAATGLTLASLLRRRSQSATRQSGEHRWYQADAGRR